MLSCIDPLKLVHCHISIKYSNRNQIGKFSCVLVPYCISWRIWDIAIMQLQTGFWCNGCCDTVEELQCALWMASANGGGKRERERESNDMPRLNWQPWHAIGVQNAARLENASVIASYTHKIHLSVVSWLATSHAGHLMDLICQQVSSMGPLSTNAMRYVWPVFGLHHHHSPRILRNQDVREIFLKTLRCDCNHVELLLEMSQSGARSCITMPDFLNLPVVFLSGLDD